MKGILKDKFFRWLIYGFAALLALRLFKWLFPAKTDVEKVKDTLDEINNDIIEELGNLDIDESDVTLSNVQAKQYADFIWSELNDARWLGNWAFDSDEIANKFAGLTIEDKKLVLKNSGVRELPGLFGFGGKYVRMYEYAENILDNDNREFLINLFKGTNAYV
jgi:hypothetical protein